MGAFSAVHWLIVLVVLLLVFGPGRLANVGKGLGEGLRNFKKGLDDEPAATDEAEEDAENEDEKEEPELAEGEAAPKLKKKAKA